MARVNLYNFLAPLSPAPGGLIWADQNAPRPAKPYATVTVRSVDPSPPVSARVDAAGVIAMTQVIRLSVEWQFIGKNALDLARMAAFRIRSETNLDRAKELGLGILNIDSVYPVPEVLNASQIEERAIVEMAVLDSDAFGDNVGLIEEVEIIGDGFCTITVRDTDNG